MLSAFGMSVNCRFLDDGSPAPVEEFCRASIDIMTSDTRNNREVMDIVTRRTGRRPFPAVLPSGIRAYEDWMRTMGEYTGKTAEAEAEIARARSEYDRLVEATRPHMSGKRV